MNRIRQFQRLILLNPVLLGSVSLHTIAHAQPAIKVSLPGEIPVVPLSELEKQIQGPTLVNLQFKDAPLEDVLKELTRQSGWSFELATNPDSAKKPVSIHLENAPILRAITQLMNAGVLSLRRTRSNNSVTFFGAIASPETPLWKNDALLGIVDGVRLQGNVMRSFLQMPIPPDFSQKLYLTGNWLFDPKISRSFVSSQIEITQATDDTGKTVRATTQDLPFSLTNETSKPVQKFNLVLPLPALNATALKVVRGRFLLAQDRRVEKWEIADLKQAKGATKDVVANGVTRRFLIQSFGEKTGEYELKMRVIPAQKLGETIIPIPAPAIPEFPPNPENFKPVPIHVSLLDENGVEINNSGQGFNYGGHEKELTFRFSERRAFRPEDLPASPQQPQRLLIEIPVETYYVEIPFEFTNIPLPQLAQ